jgi:hypothetical protein
MEFKNFLSSARTPEFWQKHKVYCFVGDEYPLTWFNALFNMLEHQEITPAPYQRIFTDSIEKKSFYATLSQSILGNFSFFWLGNLGEEKDNKSTRDFMQFIVSYQGPHTIAYFTHQVPKNPSSNYVSVINLPKELTYQQCHEMAQFLSIDLDIKKESFLKKLLPPSITVDLETSCMLIRYLELISVKYLNDYTQFLANIIGNSPSLSLLSEHFFAKNPQQFFGVWGSIQSSYPEIFWVSFWSEQIWKAYHVRGFLSEKNFVQAKRMGFRLPYSFMNRDWQKSNTKELAQAYDFLYHMDYGLKTGSTFCSLDLFYMNYFTGKFA